MRNSVKAIIINDGKLLFTKWRQPQTGDVFYILPGGGQEPGETFHETLRRECMEELGAEVDIGEIALVREYIGKNHEFADRDSHIHQIEYMFLCRLATPVNMDKATGTDEREIGCAWIALDDFKNHRIYPRSLLKSIDSEGRIRPPIYIGDTN